MQLSVITEQQMRQLLKVSCENIRPIQIDWVNRTIEVLSDIKVHPTRMLSNGPMEYQDRLISFKF